MQGGWSVGRQPPCIAYPKGTSMDIALFAFLVFSGLMILVLVMGD